MNFKDLDDKKVYGFLDWITKHKVYTIILIILITIGAGKIVKHIGGKD